MMEKRKPRWWQRLLRWHRPHWWGTTHVNPYSNPMRQTCLLCGLERRKKVNEERYDFGGGPRWPKFQYRWEYSDGRIGPWLYMMGGNADKPVPKDT